MSDLLKDTEHWQNKLPPLAPNSDEISIYKKQIGWSYPVHLLGMTRELKDLCDMAIDLNPIDFGKPVLKCDWNDLNIRSGAIIGDGVLNLEGLQLVDKLLNITNKIVCRVFLKKFEWMKYATHFPTSFPKASEVIITQPDIAMVVWKK